MRVDYSTGVAGYRDTGRWFRYVSTVLTVPPRPPATGVRGTILGPWQATQYIGTLDASAHSPVVMNAPILWKDRQNFGVWQRHW